MSMLCLFLFVIQHKFQILVKEDLFSVVWDWSFDECIVVEISWRLFWKYLGEKSQLQTLFYLKINWKCFLFQYCLCRNGVTNLIVLLSILCTVSLEYLWICKNKKHRLSVTQSMNWTSFLRALDYEWLK